MAKAHDSISRLKRRKKSDPTALYAGIAVTLIVASILIIIMSKTRAPIVAPGDPRMNQMEKKIQQEHQQLVEEHQGYEESGQMPSPSAGRTTQRSTGNPVPASMRQTPAANHGTLPLTPPGRGQWSALDKQDMLRDILDYGIDTRMGHTEGKLVHYSKGRLVQLLAFRDEGNTFTIWRRFLDSNISDPQRVIHLFVPAPGGQYTAYLGSGNGKYVHLANLVSDDPKKMERKFQGTLPQVFSKGPQGLEYVRINFDNLLHNTGEAAVARPIKVYIFVRPDNSTCKIVDTMPYIDLKKYFQTVSYVVVIEVR